MPRIRNIKPEFFTDADLGELSPLHRLLFVGLWTQADRDGRLEDRPRELKVKVLPFDEGDVEAMLVDLERGDFIIRYEAGGERYIAIPNFVKHQKFHRDEKPRGLPPPPQQGASRVSAPSQHPADTLSAGCQHAVPLQTPEVTPRASTPDVGCLMSEDGSLKAEPLARRAVASAAAPRPPSAPGDFMDALTGAFFDVRGHAYALDRRDEGAVRVLMGKGDEEEVLRRWRLGLARKTYPRISALWELVNAWNHCAAAEDTGPPARAQDIRRGVGRVDDDFGPPGVTTHAGK